MVIISQKAVKHDFIGPLDRSSRRSEPEPGNQRKNLRSFEYFLCKTKPILKQKTENSGRHGAQPGNTEDSKIMAKGKPNVFYNCREPSTNQPFLCKTKPIFEKVK